MQDDVALDRHHDDTRRGLVYVTDLRRFLEAVASDHGVPTDGLNNGELMARIMKRRSEGLAARDQSL